MYGPDESRVDPALAVTLSAIKQAVETRDWQALLPYLDDTVVQPLADFMEYWKPEDPDSRLWPLFHKALLSGGCFGLDMEGKPDRTHFYCPVFCYKFPSDMLRVYYSYEEGQFWEPLELNFISVTRTDVPVREYPEFSAPIIDQVSYQILLYISNTTALSSPDNYWFYPWTLVQAPNGQMGYIWARDTFQFLDDYSIDFSLINGRWVITWFSNG